MSESKTPRTDALWADFWRTFPNERNKASFAERAWFSNKHSELETESATLKSQLRSHIDLLQTLLVEFDGRADGAPDATDIGKFCNEMVGLYNGILLKETQTLRAERDALRKEVEDFKANNRYQRGFADGEKSALSK